MKAFYITTVGASIITNFQKTGELEERPVSNTHFWRSKLDDGGFLETIYEFLKTDPRENSAELNSLLRIIEMKKSDTNEIYLIGTTTPINEICVRTIERYLREMGHTLCSPKEVSAYFSEKESFSTEYATDKFCKDISLLIDRLIYLAVEKKEAGYEVIFNPTAGLKAHVITCAIAAFLTNSPVFYTHEEFDKVVELPLGFYLPKGRELKILHELKDKVPKSGSEYKKMEEAYSDEIERLELYGLLEREKDEAGRYFRMRITNRGLFFLNLRKEA